MGRAGSSTPRPRRFEVALAAGILCMAFGAYASASSFGSGTGPPGTVESGPILVAVDAAAQPARPDEGDTVIVSVTIENRGTSSGTARIDLIDARPNGETVDIGPTALMVPLAAGSSIVVPTQPFLAVGIGVHMLTVIVGKVVPPAPAPGESRLSIPMTVVRAEAPPPVDGVKAQNLGAPELVIGLLFVAAAILVGTAIALRGRREPEPWSLDPPPPEPRDRSPPPPDPP